MRRRTINACIIAFVLTVGATAFWSAGTEGRDGDDSANVIADNGAAVGNAEDAKAVEAPKKKKGGGLFGIFKAPIKLVGRIFGGGHDDKLARLSEKDVKNFESANVVRVNDARNPAPHAPEEAGTAREHFERGRAYLDAGQLNEAIAELSRATTLDPKMKQAHNLLAQAYDRKGLHDNARKSFERALDDQPDDPQTLNDLGYTLYLNGHYRAAVDRLKRAAKLAPTDARILNNLALAQCRLGKFDDAFKNFARAGGEFNGRMNTATLAERMGRDTEAIEQYEAARRIQRDSPAVLHRLEDLYRRAGQSDKAEEAHRALNGMKDETVAER
jgi:tetratricopeptide (TPR) repeat protein